MNIIKQGYEVMTRWASRRAAQHQASAAQGSSTGCSGTFALAVWSLFSGCWMGPPLPPLKQAPAGAQGGQGSKEGSGEEEQARVALETLAPPTAHATSTMVLGRPWCNKSCCSLYVRRVFGGRTCTCAHSMDVETKGGSNPSMPCPQVLPCWPHPTSSPCAVRPVLRAMLPFWHASSTTKHAEPCTDKRPGLPAPRLALQGMPSPTMCPA